MPRRGRTLKPRDTPLGTRVEGQLRRSFWAEYVRAYLLGGDEQDIGDSKAVFTEMMLQRLKETLSAEALTTPVLFTEKLSNSTLAGCIGFRDRSQVIAINARCKADPELLAHTRVEEFVHAQQRLEGVDFENERRRLAYQ